MSDFQIRVEPVACPIDWTTANRTARVHHCANCARPVIDLQNATPEELAQLGQGSAQPPCVLLPQRVTTVLPLDYAPARRRFGWRSIVLFSTMFACTAGWVQRYFFASPRTAPPPMRFLTPVRFVGTTQPTLLTVRGRTLTTMPTDSSR